VPLASGIDEDGDALPIRTNARVLGATMKAGESLTYTPSNADRHLYLVPSAGSVKVENVEAKARDGVAITDLAEVTITALEDSELVLVDAA
jgi:redox-sensitive bicupin YhaK (pirin superfamily)